ncbi:pentapeptide repeat-containing protein [Endozoicomonas ascidiicola]|uniref:pentapeptide repeat-containing protein n=1 Tax=Endozoicomonas ascidiicola TaxID=1698521 RepID=UPI0034516F01
MAQAVLAQAVLAQAVLAQAVLAQAVLAQAVLAQAVLAQAVIVHKAPSSTTKNRLATLSPGKAYPRDLLLGRHIIKHPFCGGYKHD